jgi:hypothetical protein
MAITKLVPGYRIRQTVFVPVDPTDTKSIRAAVDFADKLKGISEEETSPKGIVVENFSFQTGRKDAKD